MNQELKEQTIKKFWETVLEVNVEDIKSETIYLVSDENLDSLIDKTVQVTEGRIVEDMLKVFSDNAKAYSGMKGELNASAVICIKDYCEAKGFITNKSELSTNKDEK